MLAGLSGFRLLIGSLMAHAALLRQSARCSLAHCSWYARLSRTSAQALHNLINPCQSLVSANGSWKQTCVVGSPSL